MEGCAGKEEYQECVATLSKLGLIPTDVIPMVVDYAIFNPTHLMPDDFVDVFDSAVVWRLARVLHVSHASNDKSLAQFPKGRFKSRYLSSFPSVLIHYIGWDSRWDEWIPLWSNRVAPPQSHVGTLDLPP